MTYTKRGVAAWLLAVAGLASAAAYLIRDTSGAHLELAPVFVGAAVAVTTVWTFRSRQGRRES